MLRPDAIIIIIIIIIVVVVVVVISIRVWTLVPTPRVTAARAIASSVFQLFSFLVVCSGMISKGLGFVAFFASAEASHLSYLVCQ